MPTCATTTCECSPRGDFPASRQAAIRLKPLREVQANRNADKSSEYLEEGYGVSYRVQNLTVGMVR